MMNCKELSVLYRGRLVGLLKQLNSGEIGFQYDAEWVNSGFSISPFSLPLENKVFISNSPHFDGLFGVFFDCLPDGWGIRLLIRMLSKQGIDYLKLSPLEKLSLIRKNGLGGLEFFPSQSSFEDSDMISLDELAMEAEKILNDQIDDNHTLDVLYELGGSSGGARPKAHLSINQEKWIVKFPGGLDKKEAGTEEYQANILAKKAGINTNDFMLFPSEICKGYFGSRRFDRTAEGRVHMISLSSLLETSHRLPNLDYLHLFQVIDRICPDKKPTQYEVFRRMCFNVLYGNKDDHGKNFSFLYNENSKGYVLSPFYDITKTPSKAEHEMSVLGIGNPTKKDLLEIGNQVGLDAKKCNQIIQKIEEIV